jgi:hypothetical protein
MTTNAALEVVAVFPTTSMMAMFKAEFLRVSIPKEDFDELVKVVGQGNSPVLRILGGESLVI